ncbi:MAG: bifunctional chorismate mutase/prephenate dehydratase [Lachnospiraceae bacterium]|nr:bifunctional chorismate mutase/prephenate dehydratase [Lachnospiraceae bacterium]
MKIAFSGVKGAYAHIAGEKIFPGSECMPYPSFGNVYEAVRKGECDYGVLPVENSFAGDVAQVMDLLYFGELYIAGVYEMPIVHNLLGVKGAEKEDITRVYSHPQALDQCAGYIREKGFEQCAATNTAMAARDVAAAGDKQAAAIAGREAAQIYGLEILEERINEKDDNMTRFVVISREEEPLLKERQAFSMIFTVNNEAGALAKAVTTIGMNGFNLKAIRSRPARELAWNYYFYIEGEGDIKSNAGNRMIAELKWNCDVIRVLGNYHEVITLD